MNKRITSIALFDRESLNKFEKITSRINERFCKVPYIEDDRESVDTLPYHFTFTVWNIEDKERAREIVRNLKINEVKLKIIGVNVKESVNNSWNLYFEFEKNNELYEIQKDIYNLAKIEKYNPDTFIPHITIHCDRDYNKLVEIKETINRNFQPFEVRFNEIGLFEIYPTKKL